MTKHKFNYAVTNVSSKIEICTPVRSFLNNEVKTSNKKHKKEIMNGRVHALKYLIKLYACHKLV